MHYIIAKDNLNRDYHNDRLFTTEQALTLLEMKEWCKIANHENSAYFYTIIDDLSKMNLESMYDCNGEVPSYDTFCRYTGLGILPHDQALQMYNKHFHIQG